MNILALDTSSDAISVAVFKNDEVFHHHEILPRQHADKILAIIDSVITQAEIKLSDLNYLAFGRGPGSFTGIRVAASVIQGLAYSLDLKVIPISSLQILAQQAYLEHGCKSVAVAVDARMKEVYFGDYFLDNNGLMILKGAEEVIAPQNITSNASYCIANGWQVYKETMSFPGEYLEGFIAPDVRFIKELVLDKISKDGFVSAELATPVYLRDSVAHKRQ